MNHHQPVLSQVPPAVPLPNGRPGQNITYAPQPYPYYHYPQQYAYQYHHMQQRPPPQWQPYPMHMPMGRGPPGYPPMNAYPPQQHYQPMRPTPQHHPSSTSIHSAQGMLSPSPANHSQFLPPSAPTQTQSPRQSQPATHSPAARPPSPTHDDPPFQPPLPWQTFEGNFPSKKGRRKRKPRMQSAETAVEFPPRPESFGEQEPATANTEPSEPKRDVSTGPPNIETPPTSNPPSEVMSTQPTTPTSSIPPQQTTPKASNANHISAPSISIRPAVPNIPLPTRAAKRTATGSVVSESAHPSMLVNGETADDKGTSQRSSSTEAAAFVETQQPVKAPPKSWADLVRTKASQQPKASATTTESAETQAHLTGIFPTKASTLAEVLRSFNVKENTATKIAFIEPRGLVNTGNMCYMNSVLQILLFCVPFYAFLEKIGKQATHSFKSDTPMMDAMIMFMQEFKVIDAAVSIDQLRMRLKDNELEQYGEAFIPDFVYDVIRRLSRFSSMRRGHQQDAEEFLGFLLEELHDECARTMHGGEKNSHSGASSPNGALKSSNSDLSVSQKGDEGGWLEVGPKQRPAVTRSSGAIVTESPITKIFGGKLRSELRVPGMKNSVTLEPYQPLQLDIGASHVNNIVDALKGLTKPETLHGQFNSPRGPGSTATKQVTIETLPEVLILHLKRFQYDNTGGTQKIWKKVGYPLDLEIPKEVFPQHKRGGLLAHGGLPKYRLIGVVYHHGKNASTGHYTVDVRRQEGHEWIRLDDTVIRRIRSEDVAAGGSEEDPKALAAALEQHKNDQAIGNKTANFYEQFLGAEGDGEEQSSKPERAWSQVADANSGPANKKKAHVVNGNVTPKASESGKMTPVGRPLSIKDNKVAYILFYQKVGS